MDGEVALLSKLRPQGNTGEKEEVSLSQDNYDHIKNRHKLATGSVLLRESSFRNLPEEVVNEVMVQVHNIITPKSGNSPVHNLSATSIELEKGVRLSSKHVEKLVSTGEYCGEKQLVENERMPFYVLCTSPSVRVNRIGYSKILRRLQDLRAEEVALTGEEKPKETSLSDFKKTNQILRVLQSIYIFKSLPERQIQRMILRLEQRIYTQGQEIVSQGSSAEHFFLIQSGTVGILVDGKQVRTMGRWDFFGERGLLFKEKRSATCRAQEGDVICLVLDASAFQSIVGRFRVELEGRIKLQDMNVNIQDFMATHIVGKGSFGTVLLVEHKQHRDHRYALKCVNKKQALESHQIASLCVERETLLECYHPCIVQFIRTFRDVENVYFLTEFLGGGDLFFAIRVIGVLSRVQCQFYVGSIVLALEYLHERNILYRDLKPENVLLDSQGYTKLVDFGCCKKANRTFTLLGTPEYIAPEVITGKGYNHTVDWWSLGCMMYEFMCGPLPFGNDSEDQLELFRHILEAPLVFTSLITDNDAKSLISGFLERSPELRMGAHASGAKEIKQHEFFSDFDWDSVLVKTIEPPWRPDMGANQREWEQVEDDNILLGLARSQGCKLPDSTDWDKDF